VIGRLFLATVVTIAISTLVRADGADSPPSAPSAKTPAAKELPPIAAELKSDKQKGSYAIGYNVGTTLRRQIGAGNLDPAAFLLGIQQSLSAQRPALSAPEQEKAFKIMIASLRKEKMKEAAESSEKNEKKGDEFLAANKQQKGVTTLPSGLQYLVIKEGNGKQPKASDEVQVHYHGTLIDGTVFDSSINRGEPATFAVNAVIPGWTEALQLMKEGAKWRVFVPAKLAYGREGRPGIGPNQTLIFDIQLLKVK
jgi:FKBP-type peptidyl-prolyl cis-trans isomerase